MAMPKEGVKEQSVKSSHMSPMLGIATMGSQDS